MDIDVKLGAKILGEGKEKQKSNVAVYGCGRERFTFVYSALIDPTQ